MEGENSYLACPGYGDKIIKYTDFVYKEPRYYIDCINETINYCVTDEVIADFDGYTVICSESEYLDGVHWSHRGNGSYMISDIPVPFGISDYYTEVSEDSDNDNKNDFSEVIIGDINSDGKIDLTDLSALSLSIIGDKTLTKSQI